MRAPAAIDERVLRSAVPTGRGCSRAAFYPASAACLAIAYLTLCLLRWLNISSSAAATLAGGLLLPLALAIPVLRALVSSRATLRLFLALVPLGTVVFLVPSFELVDHLWRSHTGDPLALLRRPNWLFALSGALALVMGAGYAWQVYSIASTKHRRRSGQLQALTASAIWLATLALFVRFSSEARHFHELSLGLGFTLLSMAGGLATFALLLGRDVKRVLLLCGVVAIGPLVASSVPARAHLAHGHPELPAPGSLHLPRECSARTPVYLLPMGLSSIDIVEIADRYRQLGLAVAVLSESELPNRAWNLKREQWSADVVLASLASKLTEARAGTLIAVTDADLYSHRRPELQHVFQLRISHPRVAIASTARIRGSLWTDDAALRSRLYKLMSKSIGLLHCGLRESRRPRSVLYQGINGVRDLDRQDETAF